MKYIILTLFFAAVQAMATNQPKDPPTKPEPPVISKPEPKAEPRTKGDTVDRPCDRPQPPVWCKGGK